MPVLDGGDAKLSLAAIGFRDDDAFDGGGAVGSFPQLALDVGPLGPHVGGVVLHPYAVNSRRSIVSSNVLPRFGQVFRPEHSLQQAFHGLASRYGAGLSRDAGAPHSPRRFFPGFTGLATGEPPGFHRRFAAVSASSTCGQGLLFFCVRSFPTLFLRVL